MEKEKQDSINKVSVIKKVVWCLAKKCPFGLTKISTPCNLCHHRKEEILNNEIHPLAMRVTIEGEYVCYKHDKMEGYQECIFGKDKMDDACSHCGRCTRKKIISDKTEAL